MEDQVNLIYNKLSDTLRDRVVTLEEFAALVPIAMMFAAKLRVSSEQDKKTIVIAVFKRIVNDSDHVPENIKPHALLYIDTFMPTVIDNLVSAYKHDFDFKKLSAFALRVKSALCRCACCK